MTTATEIIAHLLNIDETAVVMPSDIERADIEVTGVATDQSAGRGDLAWISPRNAERFPERIEGFAGSVLIGPLLASPPASRPMRMYVGSSDPKGAFTRLVDAFFSGLSTTSWPASDPKSISADAKIGIRASIAAGAVIGSNVTIGDDVVIGPNTCIANAWIADGVMIGANCSIGLPGFGYSRGPTGDFARFPHLGRVVIRAGVEVGSNTCIDRGSLGDTVIGEGCKVDNLAHIAHNVVLGRNVMVIANAMIGGSTRIGDNAWVAPSASVIDAVTIGEGAVLGLGAVVLKTVPAGKVMVGNPARPLERRPANSTVQPPSTADTSGSRSAL